MKKAAFLILILLMQNSISSQSFSISISPPTRTITQGDTSGYTIQAIPSGGFNASVYYQLTLPSCLYGSVMLSASSDNTPYTGVRIKLFNTASLPVGTHKFTLKSFNGSIIKNDTCVLTVNPSANSLWRVYKYTNAPFPNNSNAWCTAIDKSGNFWCGLFQWNSSGQGALVCLDQNKWHTWSASGYKTVDMCGTILSSSSTTLNGEGINSICTQGDTVYACSRTQIYSVINNVLTTIPAPTLTALDEFHKLRLDPQNNLWISGFKALYKYTGSGWTTFSFTGTPFPLPPQIEDFDFDNSGNLWLAMYDLQKYDGAFWTTYGTSSGLPGTSIQSVSKAKDGSIWAGSYNNGRVYKFNSTSNTFTNYQYSPSAYGCAYNIAFNKNNQPVVGTNMGLFLYNGSAWTQYTPQNSPVQVNTGMQVVAIPWMASMDQKDNLIVANGSGGFLVKAAAVVTPTMVGIQKQEPEGGNYLIYPNPTTGTVKITNADQENFRVEVFSSDGTLVLYREKTHAEIELNLAEGIYFLRMSDDSQRMITKKILVSR